MTDDDAYFSRAHNAYETPVFKPPFVKPPILKPLLAKPPYWSNPLAKLLLSNPLFGTHALSSYAPAAKRPVLIPYYPFYPLRVLQFWL